MDRNGRLTEAKRNELNKFMQCCGTEDNGTTLSLYYSAYLSWGKWNHGTGRFEDLVQALFNKGYSVQLKHDDSETANGFMTVLTEDGIKLAHSPSFQNMFNKREELVQNFVDEILESIRDLK